MSIIPSSVKCSVCERIREESNNWFVVTSATIVKSILIMPLAKDLENEIKSRKRFSTSNKSNKIDVLDVCGEGCLSKLVSSIVTGWSSASSSTGNPNQTS